MNVNSQTAATLVSGSTLVYVSDYFSFAGADAHGHVAFAIDTNRGRDGESYQAQHLYAVLHDEQRGWVDLSGVGDYENAKQELLPIPDSPFFQFAGQPATGLTIQSSVNGLTLSVEPIVERVARAGGESVFSLGSAPATLTWQGRTIRGRVIYEYLIKQNYNLITRRSFKGLAEFQGLYLLAGSDDDLYVQSQRSAGMAKLMGYLLGFAVTGGESEQLRQIRFVVPRHSPALGIYRRPKEWRVSWQGSKGPGLLELRLPTRKGIGNWFRAGFAMGIASGEMSYGGQSRQRDRFHRRRGRPGDSRSRRAPTPRYERGEFVHAWKTGKFEDADAPNVQRVAMLLPLAR